MKKLCWFAILVCATAFAVGCDSAPKKPISGPKPVVEKDTTDDSAKEPAKEPDGDPASKVDPALSNPAKDPGTGIDIDLDKPKNATPKPDPDPAPAEDKPADADKPADKPADEKTPE